VIDLSRYVGDPAFTATAWIVIDFEGTTPAGHPAEPIEVGAVLLRLGGARLVEVRRWEALIRPPAHAPITGVDFAQTGITAAMVADQPSAEAVLAGFDATLTEPPYVTVAHHAPTEAGILTRYAHACPTLAAAPMLDTLRLARHAHPELASHTLDALLTHLGIPIPAGRHRALADAAVTAEVLQRLLAEGSRRHRWSRLAQLHQLAGLPAPAAPRAQETLF
jgi:DNA polymerase-3 subunit epsilon